MGIKTHIGGRQKMKKQALLVGMVICVVLLIGGFATSYFSGQMERKITADKAIKLTLDSAETLDSIILKEDQRTYYSITAMVEKSASVTESEVNGALKITLKDKNQDVTLDQLVFNIYTVLGEDKVLKDSSLNQDFDGQLTVKNINQTTEYLLEVYLKETEERYTIQQLKSIGGSIVIEFTSGQGAEANG